jgi:hypothetical protein
MQQNSKKKMRAYLATGDNWFLKALPRVGLLLGHVVRRSC